MITIGTSRLYGANRGYGYMQSVHNVLFVLEKTPLNDYQKRRSTWEHGKRLVAYAYQRGYIDEREYNVWQSRFDREYLFK